MISYVAVAKRFPESTRSAVDGVTLTVKAGETLALLGSSGCGKSTFAEADQSTAGNRRRVELKSAGKTSRDGDPVSLRRKIGYVFQGIGLFPHMSVRENVAVTLRLSGWNRTRQGRQVEETLDMVGLPPAEYLDRIPRRVVRRPATTRRRRSGLGGGSVLVVDGRTLRSLGRDHARHAPGGTHSNPTSHRKNNHLRHSRHNGSVFDWAIVWPS